MRPRQHGAPPHLIEVTPSRWDDDPVGRAGALIGALAGIRGVALEWVAEAGAVRFLVRARDAGAMGRVRAGLLARYPQALVAEIDPLAHPERDPLGAAADTGCAAVELRLVRPAALPLRGGGGPRHPRDRADQGVPLDGMLTAAARAEPGQWVVGQLALGPAPDGWSARLAARGAVAARGAADAARRPAAGRAPASVAASLEIVPPLLLVALATLGFRAWTWYQAGAWGPLVALGAGSVMILPLLAWVAARGPWTGEPRLPPDVAREKLAGSALAVHLRIMARGSGDAAARAALVDGVAAAARAADHPAGNALRARRWHGDPTDLTVPGGLVRRRAILGAAELAGLWYLPATAPPALAPARWRRVLPPGAAVAHGARVGVSTHQGLVRPVHLPPALLGRNHLVVAKTRRGKSTLLLHLIRSLMERAAAGPERRAVAVIDPHQDLADAVLGAVPAALADRVVYLNLADRDRPVGINLLDTDLFPGRDRTAENVVTMLHRLWPDNWGPRMEGALRASVLTLHEANQRRAPAEHYTLLDVLPLLTSPVFRAEARAQVRDPTLHVWWEETYERLPKVLQQQIATPITTKIGRFLVGEASRCALGQARSTFDPRALLRDGGLLVVNSAVGVLGEGGAALLDATMLNLLGLVVEEQVGVPPGRRTRLVVVVDESSTLGAADYPRMLSELGKYGASVVLVTQSLAKLDALDRQLRPTILANIDALTVFGVSAEDARALVPELGPELALEDLTDLDDYTCYARWWADGARLPPFSFRVDPPPPPDHGRRDAVVRRSAERYGRARGDVEREIAAAVVARGGACPSGGAPDLYAADGTDGAGMETVMGDDSEHDPRVRPSAAATPTITGTGRRHHARANDARRRQAPEGH